MLHSSTHGYFKPKEVREKNDSGVMVNRTYYQCVFCSKELVYSSPTRIDRRNAHPGLRAQENRRWDPNNESCHTHTLSRSVYGQEKGALPHRSRCPDSSSGTYLAGPQPPAQASTCRSHRKHQEISRASRPTPGGSRWGTVDCSSFRPGSGGPGKDTQERSRVAPN